MSANNLGWKLHNAQSEIADPGSAGTITVNESLATVNLVTAGAEARTLARPSRAGVVLFLHFRTDGGDCTVTPTGGYTEGGTTTIVFQHVGQIAVLVSFLAADGTTFFWRTIFHGASAALTTQLTTITIADAAGTPDYALQAVTTTSPYGLATAAEMISLFYVIQNLQVRLAEMEAIMEANGWVQAN